MTKVRLRSLLRSADTLDSVYTEPKFPPDTLVCDRITVKAKLSWSLVGGSSKEEELTILKKVSCDVKKGEVLAIMGASGCGKSTLLNVMTGWINYKMNVKGQVLLDSSIVAMNNICGYVQQSDIFYPLLTVREHLTFQAKMRLGIKYTDSRRNEIVDEIIRKYGLFKCQNSRIGRYAGRKGGISGGERKRLSLATEVISSPKILFADEPTTGLDSLTAELIVDSLLDLAKGGCTVIFTIHQPSSQIYMKLQKVLFLSEGQTMYFGMANQALEYFEKLGYNGPEDCNPADFIIKTIAIDPDNRKDSKKRIKSLYSTFKEIEPPYYDYPVDKYKKKHEPFLCGTTYKRSFIDLLLILTKRNYLGVFRDYPQFIVRSITNIVFAIFIGLSFLRLDYDVLKLVQSGSSLFILVGNYIVSVVLSITYTFPLQIELFYREHKRNLYNSFCFYFANILSDTPVWIIITIAYVIIEYFLVGYRPEAWAFFSHLGIFILTAFISAAFGYMISIIARDVRMAITSGGPITLFLVLIGGYYINYGYLPVWLEWLRYLSWSKHAYEATANINMRFRDMTCDNFFCVLFGVKNKLAKWDNLSFIIAVKPNYLPVDIGGLILLLAMFHIAGFGILLIKVYLHEK